MPRPSPGVARFLTEEEAKATGLTMICIVFNKDDAIIVLLHLGHSFKEITDDAEWVIGELEKIWERQCNQLTLSKASSDEKQKTSRRSRKESMNE